MQSSNKDSLLGVKSDGGAFDVVALVDHPRDHLHLLALHAARQNLVPWVQLSSSRFTWAKYKMSTHSVVSPEVKKSSCCSSAALASGR